MASVLSPEVTAVTQATVVLITCQSALFGYFILELIFYFQRFPQDRVGFRILVAWLAALQAAYYAVRFAGAFHTLDAKLCGAPDVGMPPVLGLVSIALTTCVEATTEGFYVWRLWRVTKRIWMRAIACTLWLYSFTAHVVWIGIAARDGRASLVGEPTQLLVIQLAFWGTFAEGIFVATCLLYELKFAGDRKVIKQSRNSTVAQLVSLAIRTSGILVIFELVVGIAVSVRSQSAFALVTEVEYAAGLYTILAAIVVLYTLNFRSVLRAAPPTVATAPTLRVPSSSGFNGSTPRTRTNSRGATSGALDSGNSTKKRPREGFKAAFGLTDSVGRLSERLDRFGTSSGGSAGGGGKKASGGSGSTSGGRRGSMLASGISVSQTVSHVEEISQVPLEDLSTEEDFLSPTGWRARERGDSKPPDDERLFAPG
ncbi:hypothetical protein JCM6882_007068 [Rhodosporidiobolus microsporus]